MLSTFFSQKFTFSFSEEDDGDITPTPSSASESIAEKTADNDVVVPNGYSHHEKEYDEPSNIEVVEEKPQPPLRVESHTTNNFTIASTVVLNCLLARYYTLIMVSQIFESKLDM